MNRAPAGGLSGFGHGPGTGREPRIAGIARRRWWPPNSIPDETRRPESRRGGCLETGKRTGRAVVALMAIAAACGPVLAAEGGGGQRPRYEIAASGETDERAAALRIEFDGAVPVGPGNRRGGSLFIQPGAVLAHRPDGQTLLGGTLGIVYRFEGAGGIIGVNAFHDLNRISGSGRARTHRQAKLDSVTEKGTCDLSFDIFPILKGGAFQARSVPPVVKQGGPHSSYQ